MSTSKGIKMQTVSLMSVFLQSQIPNKGLRLGFAQTEPPRGSFPSTLCAPRMRDAQDTDPGSPDPRAGPVQSLWTTARGGPTGCGKSLASRSRRLPTCRDQRWRGKRPQR